MIGKRKLQQYIIKTDRERVRELGTNKRKDVKRNGELKKEGRGGQRGRKGGRKRKEEWEG